MKNQSIKKNYLDNNRYLFLITSIIFGLCYIFEVPHGDDVNFYYVESGKLVDVIEKCLSLTRGSFYSLLTNIYVMYVNNLPLVVFIILMIINMYIMLEAMRQLFSKGNKYEKIINVFICCAVCSYSFVDMASAGWIDTSLSYFMPMTFTVISLIPIKKMLNGEKIKKYEYVLYIISTLIVIDNTQGMAMILGCYFVFIVYCIFNKKNITYPLFIIALSIVFAYLAITSPRFAYRTETEIFKRMPTIGMLNFLNKLDLSIFPTLRWIFFGDNPFVFICLILFAVIIFKKYRNILYRTLSIIPIISSLIFRNYINLNIAINAYDLSPKEFGTSAYGLFNLNSVCSLDLLWQYIILCSLLLIVILEIIIIVDSVQDLIIIFTLLGVGFGTRFVMGFTPTVFASHLRTYIYFAYSIIMITIMLFSKNISLIKEKYYFKLSIGFILLTILLLGYFFIYLYNYMGSSIFDLLR